MTPKTLIVCESTHHGNTKKLTDAITAKYPDVDIFDVSSADTADYTGYDLIGFASGIAYGRFYPKITELARTMPEGKNIFLIYTCGKDTGKYALQMHSIAESRRCRVLGTYSCKGYDTFGPFRVIGGLNRNHPDTEDINGAVSFYEQILKKVA